jgi:hypothetical protein
LIENFLAQGGGEGPITIHGQALQIRCRANPGANDRAWQLQSCQEYKGRLQHIQRLYGPRLQGFDRKMCPLRQ